jgi:hypothetical protein
MSSWSWSRLAVAADEDASLEAGTDLSTCPQGVSGQVDRSVPPSRGCRPGDTGPCPACGCLAVWRPAGSPQWRCCRCEPCEAMLHSQVVFDHRMPERGNPDVCRHCGRPMGWPLAVGAIFADGTAAHHACYERAEIERMRRRAENAFSAGARVDSAE